MKLQAMKSRGATVALALALLAAAAHAVAAGERPQPPGAAASGGKPPGPPPEAVEACKGKSTGAAASFVSRGGQTVAGTCQLVDGVLAVRLAGSPSARP